MPKIEEIFTILIVEDDPDDAALLRLAFDREAIGNPVQIVSNGREAIGYLQGEGQYSDRTKCSFPGLLITDLKMPLVNGFELLQWLKEHPHLFVLPSLVLSSSSEREDVQKAYCLGANAYLVKPSSLPELRILVRTVRDFWANSVKPAVEP